MSLHKFTTEQAQKFIAEKHTEYFGILRRFCKKFGYQSPQLPEFIVVDSIYSHCGQYFKDQNLINYSMPFAVYSGNEYSETIAHELCHAFCMKCFPSAPAHGRDFLWLLRDICKVQGTDKELTYHTFPLAAVSQVAEELKLHRGGCNDSSFGLKRGLASTLGELQRRMGKGF